MGHGRSCISRFGPAPSKDWRSTARIMDVSDAGAFTLHYVATLPGPVKSVLWGPLQAKEMGLDGWEVQDGGETGLIMHRPHQRLADGFQTSTLIVANRTKTATLSVLQSGVPQSWSESQRHVHAKSAVTAASLYLSRLAGKPVEFELRLDLDLMKAGATGVASQVRAAGHIDAPRPVLGDAPAPPVAPERERSGVWEI